MSSLDYARIQRAATEPMKIIATDKPGRVVVQTAHGVYTMDIHAKTCTCRDFQKHILKLRRAGQSDAHCKHLLRVLYGTRMLQAMLLVRHRKRTEWQEAV